MEIVIHIHYDMVLFCASWDIFGRIKKIYHRGGVVNEQGGWCLSLGSDFLGQIRLYRMQWPRQGYYKFNPLITFFGGKIIAVMTENNYWHSYILTLPFRQKIGPTL